MDWTSELDVGISFMDGDHEHGLSLIREMKSADVSALPGVIQSFLDHCRDHFAREEELMRKIGFFAHDPHKAEHDRVLAELASIIEELKDATHDFSGPALYAHLSVWFINHRNTMDFVTANFAIQKGFEGEV